MDSYEQKAHDLSILYMQSHAEQWNQDGELDKIVIMYKKIYAEILKRLKG